MGGVLKILYGSCQAAEQARHCFQMRSGHLKWVLKVDTKVKSERTQFSWLIMV
jgi:hypothetical protein